MPDTTPAGPLSQPPATGRIPSLDGLRALSILLVLALHTLQRHDHGHPANWLWYGLFDGASGVSLFFEISGFLITTLLLQEHARHGRIRLGGFFLRRGFRILPPLYLYIGVVLLLGAAGRLNVHGTDAISSLFFFRNFSFAPGWPFEHLWSISVEEQFYLVWPWVMVWSLRRPGLRGRYAACLLPVLVLAFSPVARVVLGTSGNALAHHTALSLRFDFLMFGCLVALLQHTARFEALYRAMTRIGWLMPVTILACNFASARFGNYFDLTVGYTLEGLAIAFFLLWCTRNPGSALGRVLNWGPVAWVGVLSYSIYLWQTLFLHVGNAAVFAPLGWIGQAPYNWAGVMMAAMLSYYVVEQPTLRLRVRIAARLKR